MTLHRVPFVVNRRNLNSGQDDWELPSSSDSPLPLVQTLISSLATPEPTMLCADIFIMYWFPHFNPEIVKALFSGSSSVMDQLSPAVWYDMVYPCSGAPPSSGASQLTRMLSAEAYCTMICGALGGFMAITWYWISSLPNRLFAVHV